MNPQQMRKIQQMQREIMKAQEEVTNAEFTKSAGGVVEVTIKGTAEI